MIILTRLGGQSIIIDVKRRKLYGVIESNKVILTSLSNCIEDKEEATELGAILKSLFKSYHCDLSNSINLLLANIELWSDLPIICTFTSYNKKLEPVQLKLKNVQNISNWMTNHNIADYDFKIEI